MGGTSRTQIYDEKRILCSHHLSKLPPELFDLLVVEPRPVDRVLNAMAVTANDLVDCSPARGLANVVANEAPALIRAHQRSLNFANRPPSPIHSFSRSRTSSSINRA